MGPRVTKGNLESNNDLIHHYYMDIINAIPDIIYWVDKDCMLKGCNYNFVEFFGLKRLKDFRGTPYEQFGKFTKWPTERIETFRLDDMKVIFSGQAQYNIEEAPVVNASDEIVYFRCNRVPLFDGNHNVTGLVVILTDITAQKKLIPPIEPVVPLLDPKIREHIPHILMVEDNYIAQKVEEAVLKGLHCKVDIAESGDKALQLFNPGKYDIVLMDIGLEDTSGYMVAKKLREKEENTTYHVPIIALTSYQADVVKYDCNDYFMDGVITKPLTSEQAQQIIKKFIYHENVAVDGLKSV
jgi:CheY-like chemotaxis protein